MFQRSRPAKYEIIQDTRIETMRQLIEPLKKHWPDLVSQLAKVIKDSQSSTRVGEILAQELSNLMEALENGNRKKLDVLRQNAHDREKELKNHIDKLTKEKERFGREMDKLQSKNEELTGQIRIQNTLIVDLHRKISNLTGDADLPT